MSKHEQKRLFKERIQVQKIVINNCYGGFNLSEKGLTRYLELKGKNAFFYKYNFDSRKYTKVPRGKDDFFSTCFTEDYGDIVSDSEVNEDDIFSVRKINRADPDLISVIEELGEEANGHYASLKIIEIPSDVKWTIEEYDGLEWVAEEHRTWH